uniref:Fibronectin type-III domain-containing protein n=1 Tax=Amphimedon queenslandica TaxID=400682 RepID=A0A1X7SE74_AMPQE
MTDPHIPGPVPQPPPVPEEDIKSTEALVKWNPPPNANGVILEYKVIAFPLRPNNSSLNIDSSRRRRQAPLESQVQRCLNFLIQTDNGTERAENGTVLVTVPGTTLQAELTNLLPFSFYEFYVEASTQVGTSIPSSSQTFATLNDAPSNVENLVGSTLDSGTIILSWFSPPCPNDLILGYDIYYIVDEDGSQKRKEIDSSQYSNETLLATSGQLVYSITGLT